MMLTASLNPTGSLPFFPSTPRPPNLSFPPSLPPSPPPRVRHFSTGASAGASGGAGSVSQEEASSTSAADVAVAAAAAAAEEARRVQLAEEWQAARACKEEGKVFAAPVLRANTGGLIVRFHSLLGFLPNPLLSPAHWCKDPKRPIQGIAKDLVGSSVYVKVVEANEEDRRLILSEKDACWSKYSPQVKVGDIFDVMVASVFYYGAFVHLRFPDGCYHLTGLVHISEISWDLVQDVRDFLNVGDIIKAKVFHIDMEKSRLSLSIRQLEDDPLLETLDKVIPLEGDQLPDAQSVLSPANVDPLPGLDGICNELLQENGITEVRFGRQALEKRVVSQDLELWVSSVPAKDNQYTLLARAGRQVQEVYLTTSLDQEGIKKAVQRVLGRVP